MAQVWESVLDTFPCDNSAIELTRLPINSLTSIKYNDTAEVQQTLATSEYVISDYDDRYIIRPALNVTWPSTDTSPNNVILEYEAGYSATTDNEATQQAAVPDLIKEAMILAVGHWLKSNSEVEHGLPTLMVPRAVDHLLMQYKMPRV